VPFVHGNDGPSIWTEPWHVVLDDLAESDGVIRTSAAIEQGPSGDVAVAARENDFLYLFFRHGADDDVTLVPVDGGRVPDDATWLVVRPGTRVVRCGRWRLVTREEGWSASLRTGEGPCTTVSTPLR
jgi:hypothetical protein